MSEETILVEVEQYNQIIDIEVSNTPSVIQVSIASTGVKGDTGSQGVQGDAGYTPIKGIDYFDGDKGDKGDPGDPATNLVTSVNSKQGIVILDKTDIGLSNVDNTSDTDKPVSSATATALSNKVDKVAGKQLSTEDYTSGEKAKLASVADGAEVNVQADWNAVTGDAEILNKPTVS